MVAGVTIGLLLGLSAENHEARPTPAPTPPPIRTSTPAPVVDIEAATDQKLTTIPEAMKASTNRIAKAQIRTTRTNILYEVEGGRA